MKANTKNITTSLHWMESHVLEETDSFTYLGSNNQSNWQHRRRHQSKDTESKSGIVEKQLESKTNQNEHQTENIQFKCQGSFTLWIGDMANYTEDTRRNTDLHQQMKKRRGRPQNTWQRDTEKETKEMGYTRREMEKMATDRKRWRSLVASVTQTPWGGSTFKPLNSAWDSLWA